jgi:hypothetical protein
MAVGQNETVGCNYKSRTVSGDVTRLIFAPLLDFDVRDGRRDALYRAHHRARVIV